MAFHDRTWDGFAVEESVSFLENNILNAATNKKLWSPQNHYIQL